MGEEIKALDEEKVLSKRSEEIRMVKAELESEERQ